MHERVDPPRAGVARISICRSREVSGRDHAGADRVVDVVVDVRDPVDQADDLSLERRGLRARPEWPRFRRGPPSSDSTPGRRARACRRHAASARGGERRCRTARLDSGPEPPRRYVQTAGGRGRARVRSPRPDLVEPQRPGDRARHLSDLERVREPRAVVIAARCDEYLRLVLEPSERLAVDDPVAVALKRRTQAAVGLARCRRAGYERVACRKLGLLARAVRAGNAEATAPPGCS